MSERRALLVGTDFFQDENLSRLLAPQEDVHALREALLSREIGAFDKVELRFNADRIAIESALHELFDDRDPEDLTLFYYSGHGLVDRHNRLYFSLHASRAHKPAIGSLEASYVRQRMDDSTSRRQIVILDCCHSGAFMRGAKRAKGDPALTAETFDPVGYGRYVLTACSATEFAWEDGQLRDGDPHSRPRSVFTRWLVEGLAKGDAVPESDIITIDALYRYVHRRVRHEGASMEPQVWVDHGAGDLIIARNPYRQRKAIEGLRGALEHPSRHVRLGAVKELVELIADADTDAPVAQDAKQLLREHYDREDSRQVASAIEQALTSVDASNVVRTSTPVTMPEREDTAYLLTGARPQDTTKSNTSIAQLLKRPPAEHAKRHAAIVSPYRPPAEPLNTAGQLMCTLQGHSGSVESVTFSPDGQRLASGSIDSTIKLWDASTGQLLRTLEGHSNWVRSVAFSFDGQRLASGSDDKTIKLWDASTGQLLRTLEGHSNWVRSVAFSFDGQRLASGSDDKTIKLWDASTGQLLRTLEGHSNWVRSVAFSFDGQRLASGSDDKTIKLWDASTGQLLRTLEGHSNCVRSVAFSFDGQRLASGSDDKTIKLWDTSMGQLLRNLQGRSGSFESVAFSPDGQRLASGSDDKTIKLWDASTGQLLRTLKGSSEVHSVTFSPDGQRLASACEDSTTKLWDTRVSRAW